MNLMAINRNFLKRNTTYNLADAVIVHCEDMKQQLVRLKVQENKVHVVLHGTGLPEVLPDSERSGIVFYGGHKLMSGKGIETVFKAMAIIKARMGEATPTLKIHGHYGPVTPKEGAQLALDNGVDDKVVWLNQISEEDMVRLYQTIQGLRASLHREFCRTACFTGRCLQVACSVHPQSWLA